MIGQNQRTGCFKAGLKNSPVTCFPQPRGRPEMDSTRFFDSAKSRHLPPIVGTQNLPKTLTPHSLNAVFSETLKNLEGSARPVGYGWSYTS